MLTRRICLLQALQKHTTVIIMICIRINKIVYVGSLSTGTVNSVNSSVNSISHRQDQHDITITRVLYNNNRFLVKPPISRNSAIGYSQLHSDAYSINQKRCILYFITYCSTKTRIQSDRRSYQRIL